MDIGRLISKLILVGFALAALGPLVHVCPLVKKEALRANSSGLISLGAWNRQLTRGRCPSKQHHGNPETPVPESRDRRFFIYRAEIPAQAERYPRPLGRRPLPPHRSWLRRRSICPHRPYERSHTPSDTYTSHANLRWLPLAAAFLNANSTVRLSE